MAPRREESDVDTKLSSKSLDNTENDKKQDFKPEIVWLNVILFVYMHLAAVYGLYCFSLVSFKTFLFTYILSACSGLGITAGAHRLWAHRTYKARLPLKLFLVMCQTLALQNSIYEWSRDHRVHHKHTETNADPHNARRGFFFSHMGWLLLKKHPDVRTKGGKVPMDDLMADPIIYYQHKFYKPLALLFSFVLPTLIPYFLFNDPLTEVYFVQMFRYVFTLHSTWLVNSVAHMWGDKPYDKRINPVENLFVSFGALGEGFHNYHHTFPQDYATSEFGATYFNFTKFFIDTMAFLGLAYDLKKVSPEMVLERRKRTGDLSPLGRPEHESENIEHEF